MIKKQFALIVSAFTFVMMFAAFSWAGAAPATVGDLPPRPTEIPTTEPTSPTQGNFSGGLITLSAPITQTASADYWTVVEWKDMEGSWNMVDGWQGEFDGDGQVMWWVAPKNLGEENFRWVVYTDATMDSTIFTSDPFSLPDSNGTKLTITADLDN